MWDDVMNIYGDDALICPMEEIDPGDRISFAIVARASATALT